MKKFLPVLTVTLLLLMSSCKSDLSPEVPVPPAVTGIPKLPATPVSGSVSGIIVNENNIPVANAQVMVANTVYITDNQGFFNSGVHTLDKYISTVKVTVPGYFTAYRSFCANAARNYVSIQLIPKTLIGTFSSNMASTVSLPNLSTISFQANSINTKSSGSAYSGTVKVYAAFIDPSAADFTPRIPGSLMGEDLTKMFVLRAMGMVAVELESDGSIPLQLAPGKPASMKMIIPSALLSSAAANVDSWSLDERGIWIRNGTAVKNGNAYDFAVDHFSFWSWSLPQNPCYLEMNLKDQNANNLVNMNVLLWYPGTLTGTGYGITDNAGNVSGMVPMYQSLQMKVFAGHYVCNTPFHTQNIGPFNGNAYLNIVTPLPASDSWFISGTATDCSGAPLQSGYAFFTAGIYMGHIPVSNGTYSLMMASCHPITSFNVILVNTATQQQSPTVTVPVTSNVITLGNISACGISTEGFINYALDGVNYSVTGPTAETYGNKTYLRKWAWPNNMPSIALVIAGNSAGTFPVTDSLGVNDYSHLTAGPGSTGTITQYAAVGQFIEGNFNINFMAGGSLHSLTGNFRSRRNN